MKWARRKWKILRNKKILSVSFDQTFLFKRKVWFEKAIRDEIKIFMLIVNLCEVYYDCLRSKGLNAAEALLRDINQLPISVATTKLHQRISEAYITLKHYLNIYSSVRSKMFMDEVKK